MEPTRRMEHKVTRDDGTFVEEEFASLSSIEITRNAKGETQWSVKVYDADPGKALIRASHIYDTLALQYGVKPT